MLILVVVICFGLGDKNSWRCVIMSKKRDHNDDIHNGYDDYENNIFSNKLIIALSLYIAAMILAPIWVLFVAYVL